MKHKKIILLSLLAMALTGCSDKSNRTPSVPASKEPPVSNRVSTHPNSDNKNSNNKNSDTSKPSVSKSDSNSKKDSASSSASSSTRPSPSKSEVKPSTSTEEDSKWNQSVQDQMKKYLGGNILPYVDLGTRVQTTYDENKRTLSIIGSNSNELTQARLDKAKQAFEKAGYTVSVSDSEMVATLEEKGLEVTFYNPGVYQLDAVYTEPFDPSQASSWPQEIIDDLNTNINSHAPDIPFVYLGTVNPTGEKDSEENLYTITGGVWDERIVTLASQVFENVNKSIPEEANKWTVTTSSTGLGSTLTAKVTLKDTTEIEIHIRRSYSYGTSTTAVMTIQYTEPFVVPTSGSWDKDISDFFRIDCEGHALPYIYLGTKHPTLNVSGNKGVITGGEFNAQVLDLLNTALEKENASLKEDEKWVIEKKNDYVSAFRIYSDSASIHLMLDEGELSEKAELTVTYFAKYAVPSGSKWKDETLAAFQTNLGGNMIPYVYLNTSDETVSFNKDKSILTITGGDYYDSVLTDGYKAFSKADGWDYYFYTEFIWDYSYDYYEYETLHAEKIINASTGEKLSVVLSGTIQDESGVSGNCVMDITYTKPYTPPTGDDAKWDDATLNYLRSHLAGHSVPYIYLNSDTVKADYVKKNYPKDEYVTLTGGRFDDHMFDYATAQYADWTIKKTSMSFTATMTEADGCKLTVKLSSDYNSGLAVMEIRVAEAFNPNVQSDWSDDLKKDMKSVLHGYTIPYIPLGCYSPTYTKSGLSDSVTIKSLTWDDSIPALAKNSLTAAGWNVFDNDYETAPTLNAYQKNDDGSMLVLELTKGGTSKEPLATVSCYYIYSDNLPAPLEKTDWSESEKASLDALTGNKSDQIPFLYMGGGDYTIDASTNGQLVIEGTAYSKTSLIEYGKLLEDAGYQKFGYTSLSYYSVSMEASYKDDSGNQISIKAGSSTNRQHGKLTITYTEAVNEPTGEDAKWDDTIKAKINSFLKEDVEIPYVFLGSQNPTTDSVSDKELDIIGSDWDEKYLDKALAAFQASDGWNASKDDFDETINATYTTPLGKMIKVVVLEKNNKATLEILIK